MRNKTGGLKMGNGKQKNVPKKRNFSPKTDAAKPEVTQRLAEIKGSKSKSSKITSLSCAVDDSPPSRKTKKFIGRFFYESGLDLEAVNLPSFQRMISHFSETTNHEITIPTRHELKGWIFEDTMGEILEHVHRIRDSWAHTGCTIMLDEWTDKTGRDLVNVLVESPKGTVYLRSSEITGCIGNMDAMLSFLDRVLEEVGPANVVQLMTTLVSPFMKEVSWRLMERHRSIFWTMSASSCVGLMLEKMKDVGPVRETLNRMRTLVGFIHSNPSAQNLLGNLTEPSRIGFTQPFLILENLVGRMNKLKSMFLSPDSSFASTESGKMVAGLIGDRSFWSGAATTLQAVMPLVRAVEWMDKNRKEQIGYIYETIDQVKETIKNGFDGKESEYQQFWEVIDEVWSGFLYSPLHAGGYFLNPNLFYSEDVFVDPEVATGLVCCVVRAAEETVVQDRITVQIEKYRFGTGGFRLGCADGKFDVSPVRWWSKYGTDCPELQRLAVRILGQTCDGPSKFQLKKSLAERLFKKGLTREEQKKSADMVFLQYNMHLKNFASRKAADIITTSDDMSDVMNDLLGDWAGDDVPDNDDVAMMVLDGGSSTDRVGKSSGVSSCVVPKNEDL